MDFAGELLAKLSAGQPTDLKKYLLAVEEGVPYLNGSLVRLLAPSLYPVGGLVIPSSAVQGPLNFIGVILTADEYLLDPGFGLDVEKWRANLISLILSNCSRTSLLESLLLASALFSRDDETTARAVEAYATDIGGLSGEKIRNLLRAQFPPRVFFTRQVALLALRQVLAREDLGGEGNATVFIAILLCHLIGGHNSLAEFENQSSTIAGLPIKMVLHLVSNFHFNASIVDIVLLDRALRLWREYGEFGTAHLSGCHPADVLEEILGLTIEEVVFHTLALYHHVTKISPDDIYLSQLRIETIDGEKSDKYLRYVSADETETAVQLRRTPKEWDYSQFQKKPILRTPRGLVVLDKKYLVEKVSLGLYWVLHDHYREKGFMTQWTQAWGAMLERLALDLLMPHALPIIGGGNTAFTDEQQKAALGSGRNVELVIDFLDLVVYFEVVSAQWKTGTYIEQDEQAFKEDLEKIVFKKLRQLSGAIQLLFENPNRLLGHVVSRRILPVVVAGEYLSMTPEIRSIIDNYVRSEKLFIDGRISKAVIVNIGELEMLQGAQEHGIFLKDLLIRWQNSSLSTMPLKNWLLTESGIGQEKWRSNQLGVRFSDAMNEMLNRLRPNRSE